MKVIEPHVCHDCGAAVGATHTGGCDVERCMLCGNQLLGCGCVYEVNGFDRASLEEKHPDIYTGGATDAMWEKYDAEVQKIGGPEIWTGIWPGSAECVEYGFYSKWVEGKGIAGAPGGWVICDADDPEAGPNLNRLNEWGGCTWSRTERKWKYDGKPHARIVEKPEDRLRNTAADLAEVASSVVAAWDLLHGHDGPSGKRLRELDAWLAEIERLRKMVIEIAPLVKLEPKRRFS